MRDLVGVPFKKMGRSVEEGFDCLGLFLEVCERRGIDLGQYDEPCDDYSPERTVRLAEVLPTLSMRVVGEFLPNDVALIRWPDSKFHITMNLGSDMWIHADEKIGVCVVRGKRITRYILDVYRLEGSNGR